MLSIEKSEEIKRQRGLRVADVRHLLRMSRIEFAEFIGISPYTLRSWESGKFGGIPEKGAITISETVSERGLVCDKQWLMEEVGQFPSFSLSKTDIQKNLIAKDRLIIEKEINQFKENYFNHLVMEINDDAMLPFFIKGTFVAGIIIDKKEYVLAEHTLCIMTTLENNTICGEFLGKDEKNNYLIQSLNPKEIKTYSDIKNIAPIIFTRKLRII